MLLETIFCTMLGVGGNVASDQLSVPLNHTRYRDWNIELPHETFTPVGAKIELVDGKYSFAANMQGSNLMLDLDGDGNTDVRVSGEEGSALLRYANGFRYAIRLKHTPNGWYFASSGAQVGKFEGQRIALFDQNNDGFFGEVGQDAILIGQGKIATWLGTSVLLSGQLHSLQLDAAGEQLQLSDYQGETGSINVAAGFHGQGKILSAVLRSVDNKHCFDLAGATAATTIPVGQYRIVAGKIGLGEQAVMVAPGFATLLQVAPNSTEEVHWGGPVRAEFEFQRSGGEIAFAPDMVWYYGSSGEEYVNWKPVGKSPVFKILDRVSNKEVARAIFPGSC